MKVEVRLEFHQQETTEQRLHALRSFWYICMLHRLFMGPHVGTLLVFAQEAFPIKSQSESRAY